jgi:hypothetical protein
LIQQPIEQNVSAFSPHLMPVSLRVTAILTAPPVTFCGYLTHEPSRMHRISQNPD